MPIEVDWGNFEEDMIIFKVNGAWTGTEFVQALDNAKALAESKSYQVSLLADMRYSAARTPQNFITILRAAMQRDASRLSQAVVVTHSRYWQQLINIIESSTPIRLPIPVTFVSSVDEAIQMLEDVRDNEE